MDYNIKSGNIPITLEVREYIDKKLQHLEKLLTHYPPGVLDIEFSQDTNIPDAKYHASIRSVAKHDMYAQADGATLHEAIDIAVSEFTREAVHLKEKRRHTIRSGAKRVKDFFRGLRKRP